MLPGLAAVVLTVHVLLEVVGQAQQVLVAQAPFVLDAGAVAVVVVPAAERRGPGLAVVAGVVVGVKAVLVGVVIGAHLQPVGAEVGGAAGVDAGLVPGRPLPVARRTERIAGIGRIALLAFLALVADHVFVAVVGRQPDLEVDLAVGGIAVVASAAVLEGVGPVVVGETEVVLIQVGHPGLHVPVALVAAEVGVDAVAVVLAVVGKAQPAADLALEGLHRLARDQVDRPAEGVRPVGHRAEALGHLDARQLEGGEAAEVGVAVIGHIDRNAVEEDRHLAQVEAAHVDHLLVTRADPAQVDARHQVQRLAQRLAVVLAHGLAAQRIAAAQAALALAVDDTDLTELEDVAPGFGGNGERAGRKAQRSSGEQPADGGMAHG